MKRHEKRMVVLYVAAIICAGLILYALAVAEAIRGAQK